MIACYVIYCLLVNYYYLFVMALLVRGFQSLGTMQSCNPPIDGQCAVYYGVPVRGTVEHTVKNCNIIIDAKKKS